MGDSLRRYAGFVARAVVTAAVFALLFARVDRAALAASFERLSADTVVVSFSVVALGLFVAVVRWRTLLSAYGASRRPEWLVCMRWYVVSMFYNLLPGAVGGDVVRGYATRHCFAVDAATRSIAVVFIERVFGLAGLFTLAALASLSGPSADRRVLLLAALGLCAASAAVAAVTWGRHFARYLPARMAKVARALPTIERPLMFALALPLSVLTHIAAALAGHVVIASLSTKASLASSLVIFPLGSLAAYFPFTVAGAGARDGALAVLFARIGVARADALTTSLTLLAGVLFFASLGGLLQLVIREDEVFSSEPSSH
jgi:uncharacterized membrane protein YbhN (UPF0104 family)